MFGLGRTTLACAAVLFLLPFAAASQIDETTIPPEEALPDAATLIPSTDGPQGTTGTPLDPAEPSEPSEPSEPAPNGQGSGDGDPSDEETEPGAAGDPAEPEQRTPQAPLSPKALFDGLPTEAQPLANLLGDTVVRPVEEEAANLQRELDALTAPEESAEEDEPDSAPVTSAAAAPEMSTTAKVILITVGAAAATGAAALWLAGSTGAGTAGALGAKAAGPELRRVLPYASPLFTRFEKDTVLGHPRRERIYALVVETPGITLQDLCAKTGLSRTAVTHHMRLLEHQHLLVSKRVGRSRHFYENGGRYGRQHQEAYAVLQNDRSRDVARMIREKPGLIQKDLCAKLGIQASVAHWHVKRLVEAHLVEPMRDGRTVHYYPASDLQSMEVA